MEKHPEADLRVYAIWVDVPLDGDLQGFESNPLNDHRVINVPDPRFEVAKWFPEQDGYRDLVDGGLAWDVYFLYGPDARWDAVPGPLVSSGWTISGARDRLHEAITPLLSPG